MNVSQTKCFMLVTLLIACIRICLPYNVTYVELVASNVIVLLSFLFSLFYYCCRNKSIILVTVTGMIYVLSTSYRALFPTIQESKACYISYSPPPAIDRLVALIGELSVALQYTFTIVTVLYTVGLSKSKCMLVFYLSVLAIVVAEVFCYMGCLKHPAYNVVEIDLWSAVAGCGMLASVFILFYAKRKRVVQMFLVVLAAQLALVIYNTCFYSLHFQNLSTITEYNGNMNVCQNESKQVWNKWFSEFAYPYYVICASVSSLVPILIHKIRSIDDNASKWLF